jgi:hypothetical protein
MQMPWLYIFTTLTTVRSGTTSTIYIPLYINRMSICALIRDIDNLLFLSAVLDVFGEATTII